MAADFNPRPPRGGRPNYNNFSMCARLHFNPRPPRGGRRAASRNGRYFCGISIHAPREGGDPGADTARTEHYNFNPRPPRGGRPRCCDSGARSDRYFNPRPPQGGRPAAAEQTHPAAGPFQSTPPARGATPPPLGKLSNRVNFNPRPPRGGRLPIQCGLGSLLGISIHAPREGGDVTTILNSGIPVEFQSTPPARGATQ